MARTLAEIDAALSAHEVNTSNIHATTMSQAGLTSTDDLPEGAVNFYSPNGLGIEITGTATYAVIAAKTGVEEGEIWISTTADSGAGVAIHDGLRYDSSAWINIGPIQGITGATGAIGSDVDHILKTSTSGLIDTYTMYQADNTVIGTFTVTNGTDIDHVTRTSGTGAAGTTDTYTMYDVGDTVLGTFDVYNGADGDGAGDMVKSVYDPTTANRDIFSIVDATDKYNASLIEEVFEEIADTNFWNGYDRVNPDTMGDLSWNNSTRTVSLAVHSGESDFHYWANGKKVICTTTKTYVVPETTSETYYIYMKADGTMDGVAQSGITLDIFFNLAITAIVNWNTTTNIGKCGEERHGIRMSAMTHYVKHMTTHAQYSTGFEITGLTDGGATFTGIESGIYFDEDVEINIAAQTIMGFMYRSGADTDKEWTFTAADNGVGEGGTGAFVWSQLNSGNWGNTAITGNDCAIMFIMATNELGGVCYQLIGQNLYSNARAARAAVEGEIKTLKTDGLPNPEFLFLHAYIIDKDGLKLLADDSTHLDFREVVGGTPSAASSATVAANVSISDSGSLLTADNVEDALQENRELIDSKSSVASSTFTVTVGTTGDYATLQAAIDALIYLYPKQSGTQVLAVIQILTGTTITDRVRIYNYDCGWMQITSVDAVVTVTVSGELFYAYQATLPQISTLFDMEGNGTHGISCIYNSNVLVYPNCGIKNAGSNGMYLANSKAVANDAIFTGAALHGIDVRYGSSCSLRDADVSDAVNFGINVTYASYADFYNGIADNCKRGIDVSAASSVAALNAHATACTEYGVHVTGASNLDIYNANISGCTGYYGVYCAYGAKIDAANANARMGGSDASTDFHVSYGATIIATGGTGGTSITINTLLVNGIIFK